MRGKNKKPDVIEISESEEEEDSDESLSSDEDSESNPEEDDVVEDEADLESSKDEDSEYSSDSSSIDDQTRYNQVIDLLKGGQDLQALKLDDCKTYLRKHGLRLTGTKEVCIQRIQEHWRIKDGKGEEFYPRSSFTINCTGDVCKGDIVLFKQRIYEKFDKVTRTGKLLGGRTVAGRVVNESYGAAKHQHTFTVEVLWSKGTKKLPPMFPLLVKGRNLYRLRTFRQPWHNEAERSKVLAEKHARGTEARRFRTLRKAHLSSGGAKHRKRSHQTLSPRKSCRTQESEAEGTVKKRKYNGDHAKTKSPRYTRDPRLANHRDFPGSSSMHFQPNHLVHQPHTSHYPPASYHGAMQSHPWCARPVLYYYTAGSQSLPNNMTSSTAMPMANLPFRSAATNVMMGPPKLQVQGYNSYDYGNGHLHGISSGVENSRRGTNGPMNCSTPGCRDLRAKNCVVFSCMRCCRRQGRRCHRHRTN